MKTHDDDGKTFNDNMRLLVDGIFKAMKLAEPKGWHTWDSFAGRQVYHEQPLEEARKEAVVKFLTMVFEDNTSQALDSLQGKL